MLHVTRYVHCLLCLVAAAIFHPRHLHQQRTIHGQPRSALQGITRLTAGHLRPSTHSIRAHTVHTHKGFKQPPFNFSSIRTAHASTRQHTPAYCRRPPSPCQYWSATFPGRLVRRTAALSPVRRSPDAACWSPSRLIHSSVSPGEPGSHTRPCGRYIRRLMSRRANLECLGHHLLHRAGVRRQQPALLCRAENHYKQSQVPMKQKQQVLVLTARL